MQTISTRVLILPCKSTSSLLFTCRPGAYKSGGIEKIRRVTSAGLRGYPRIIAFITLQLTSLRPDWYARQTRSQVQVLINRGRSKGAESSIFQATRISLDHPLYHLPNDKPSTRFVCLPRWRPRTETRMRSVGRTRVWTIVSPSLDVYTVRNRNAK